MTSLHHPLSRGETTPRDGTGKGLWVKLKPLSHGPQGAAPAERTPAPMPRRCQRAGGAQGHDPHTGVGFPAAGRAARCHSLATVTQSSSVGLVVFPETAVTGPWLLSAASCRSLLGGFVPWRFPPRGFSGFLVRVLLFQKLCFATAQSSLPCPLPVRRDSRGLGRHRKLSTHPLTGPCFFVRINRTTPPN